MTVTDTLSLDAFAQSFPLKSPFRIAGKVFTSAEVVEVSISDGRHVGRGEASGIYYLGDDANAMLLKIEASRELVGLGITRAELQRALPPGGARNAIDAALWELEARRKGRPVWDLAGLDNAPKPVVTTFTLGADSPSRMARAAADLNSASALKLKLTGDLTLDSSRVQAVRAVRPDCWIGVDANQGYDISELDELVRMLLLADVQLLEQPLKRGLERDLQGFKRRLPIAADESVLCLDELPKAVGLFDVINIKLDKCGGLTEALELARAVRALGMKVMVGNMVGTSLAMAPAFILAQLCDIVDLDGPTFLAEDRRPSISYDNGKAWVSEDVWGAFTEEGNG